MGSQMGRENSTGKMVAITKETSRKGAKKGKEKCSRRAC